MELVPSICLSSLAGAIFFFTGGRLSAPKATSLPDASADAEREMRARAEHEAQQARIEAERAIAEIGEARANVSLIEQRAAALDHELAEARAHRAAFEERAAVLDRDLASSRASEEAALRRASSLDRDLARTRAESAQTLDANRRLAARIAELDARTARVTELESRAGEADRLRAEKAALEAANTALKRPRPAAPEVVELQKRNAELSVSFARRGEELNRREAENADLRAKIEDLTARVTELDELRRRVIELEAQGFARRLEDPAPPSRPPPEGASLATVLERELGRLVDREEGCRMAVLADPRGLLIAASDGASYPHEVAAASSLTTYASDRLRELLPLGAPASLELYDDNGLCVRTRWIRFDDECFLVSTVGVVDPRDVEAELLRARLGELIGS